MPQLTDDQLHLARSWIGNTESDDTFQERYDRLNSSLDAAVLESLRAQLAALTLDQPSGLSTPDGLNLQYGQNIQALQALLKQFLAIGGTDPATVEAGGVNVTQLSRSRPR